METPGSASEVSEQDILRVFLSDRRYIRFTTTEIAEELDCPSETVQTTLEELAARGDLHKRELADSTHLWWPKNRSEMDESMAHRPFKHEQFGAFINVVKDYAIFLLDPEGNVVSWNHGAERIKGYAESEIIGNHFSTFYTQDDIDDGIPERRLEAAADAGSIEDEGWRVRKDGSHFWANVTITAIWDDGDLQGYTKVTRDMTKRREYERHLEVQAARLERQRDDLKQELDEVFERVDDAVYALDDEFRFTYINDTAEAYFGRSAGDLLGRNIWEALGIDEADSITAKFETAMATQEPMGFERYSDPLEMWEMVRVYPSETGLSVYFRDISERKERERALERYETLIEESADINAILDPDGMFEYVTPSVAYVLGYDPEVLVGENAFEHIHPDDRRETRAVFSALVDEAEDTPKAEFRFRADDDSWVWLEAHGRNLLDDPDIDGLVVYTRDVTDRKRYEEELESRARQQEVVAELGQTALENPDLDDLFDEAAQLVAETLDNDYCKVLDLDRGAEELLLRQGVGWQPGIVGEATVSSVEADSQASYTLLTEGPVVVTDLDTESRFSGPDLLTSHNVRSGISTVIGSVDDPWGILGTHDTRRRMYTDQDVNFVQSVANILADTIDRHTYQDDLVNLVGKLEESNERLDQFAYIVSHDLQEPLRMISSYLQVIERRYGDVLDEDGEEFIAYAVDGADRMREMIDDLLAYARIATQAQPLEPTDCETVVERVRRNLEVQIEESGAEIVIESMPTVLADENQVEQVFQNLVSNAIKYRADELPHIQIGAERTGDDWVFRVADNGIGMDPEQTDRIFEVFQRLHTNEEYSGTGIGLALCQQIVERHGGDIWVESEPSDGSTFYFTIPNTEW